MRKFYQSKIAKMSFVLGLVLAVAMPASLAFADSNNDHGIKLGQQLSLGLNLDGNVNVGSNVNGQENNHKSNINRINLTGTVSAVDTSNNSLTFNAPSTAQSATSYNVDLSQLQSKQMTKRFGQPITNISEIQVGDQIHVVGAISGNNIVAQTFQDLSLQSRQTGLSGNVVSVGTNMFVLGTKSFGNQTVNLTSSTVIKQNGQTGQFSEIAVGVHAVVQGLWDSTNNNIQATTINLTIPKKSIMLHGTLTAVSGNTLTIAGSDGVTYTVQANGTVISLTLGRAKVSDLKINDTLYVFGKSVPGSGSVTSSLVVDTSL